MPIAGRGWELLITRLETQDRGGVRRTIGRYQVFRDGTPRPALSGTTAEPRGPGDNTKPRNYRRVEAGRYPLAVQNAVHYSTLHYIVSKDPKATPKPALLLSPKATGHRSGVLVHPGHDFLASIGCINLTSALATSTVDIPFIDSRDRVIAVIDDLKAFVGDAFPKSDGALIPDASIVVDGDP